MTVNYFAYGSNMSLAQMRERCPEHERVGIALLPDHALCFPRSSPVRLCGVAGIEERSGSEVWGVVYRLNEKDLTALDRREGCDPARAFHENRYNRHKVTVLLNGNRSRPLPCLTYLARPEPGEHVPSTDYMGRIIVGAEENNLPADYLKMLRSMKCR